MTDRELFCCTGREGAEENTKDEKGMSGPAIQASGPRIAVLPVSQRQDGPMAPSLFREQEGV